MRAFLALREGVHYRREAFSSGLKRLGYSVHLGLPDRIQAGDLLCIWNRYGQFDRKAAEFEARGLPVIVAENGYLGNDFLGQRWYSLSLGQHNGAGRWFVGDNSRWDRLDAPVSSWRDAGGEIVILPQRGIGPVGVAMPRLWGDQMRSRLKLRIRRHPGQNAAVPLEHDLANASGVVTWGSGAALKSLLWGIPVVYDFPKWIGAGAGVSLKGWLKGEPLKRDDTARLDMFRRLAWAMWRLEEISSGEAFKTLLAAKV